VPEDQIYEGVSPMPWNEVYSYWLYANPLTGDYLTSAQGRKLAIFDSEEAGRALERHCSRMRHFVGHWMTGPEVRQLRRDKGFADTLYVDPWGDNETLGRFVGLLAR
jgi:hypothetical protein